MRNDMRVSAFATSSLTLLDLGTSEQKKKKKKKKKKRKCFLIGKKEVELFLFTGDIILS
jgi:hypothetical protein